MVEKPVVVTSISVYEDLVKQIAGSACEVHSLVQGMENPHTFDLSGSKIRQVAQADLLVLNGLGLEGWSRQLLAGIDTSHTRYVFVADSLMNSPLLIHNDNPHFWMDPRIGQQIVNILLPEIQALVPDSQAIFRERAAGYLEELEQLYHDIGVKLEPLKSNKVIAQTPGLDYFFSAFGIERTDVMVSHPGTEPSARKMKELVDLLQTGEVFAIIRFPQFSEKLPQTLSTESN
ncbi:MAG TPA: metal ABC transporter substrate-binding protein, partial [bacterium]|nr:metal ABC transporter substrate-binding protein [bacterium]